MEYMSAILVIFMMNGNITTQSIDDKKDCDLVKQYIERADKTLGAPWIRLSVCIPSSISSEKRYFKTDDN